MDCKRKACGLDFTKEDKNSLGLKWARIRFQMSIILGEREEPMLSRKLAEPLKIEFSKNW
jgi:hypothetical protein